MLHLHCGLWEPGQRHEEPLLGCQAAAEHGEERDGHADGEADG